VIDKQTGIWSIEAAEKKGHKHDEKLVRNIIRIYPPQSTAADLGCGDGWYCKKLFEARWPVVHGYEGTPEMAKNGYFPAVFTMDLSEPQYMPTPYDFVLCLEVGEHIPEAREQTFLDNINLFASQYLVLSWAVPGQGGRGHFNERPNTYIIGQMEKRGWKLSAKTTAKLRSYTTYKWFRNSIMAFKRDYFTAYCLH
jgi:hypothetical protein